MRVAPLLDDNLLKALDRKEGWLDLGGVVDGSALAGSDFFPSFEPGVTAAPKGSGFSNDGLGFVFAVCGDEGVAGVEGVLELEENLELIVDIHELRRPGEAGRLPLGSFVPFRAICTGDGGFSVSVLGRGIWWLP